ncbi:DUF7351 domain-containing protein [Halorarum halobium]|uniref:DUF7351 domain-containing protein n=1 Tax=Halorarum halobium TaxID=3075121 RepID=UPI0028B03715|nr:hypothetical protein [Halobaculum sp. XH14]
MDHAGEEGLSPQSAFALLGDELRLAILFSLYEATERVGRERSAITYSELQDAVGEPDSGKFNYHLSRLRGQFVEKVDGGYAMRQAGRTVVRSVLSGTFTDDPRFGPIATDAACFACGGEVTVSYRNEHVFTRCRDCAGTLNLTYTPPGTLSALVYPPAGLTDRGPNEVLELVHDRFEREVGMLAADTCPECGSESECRLVVCHEHEGDVESLCPHCNLGIGAVAELGCLVCGFDRVSPPLLTHTRHPAVFDLLNHNGRKTSAWERFGVAMTREFSVLDATEPTVTYAGPDGESRLRIDADLSLTVE